MIAATEATPLRGYRNITDRVVSRRVVAVVATCALACAGVAGSGGRREGVGGFARAFLGVADAAGVSGGESLAGKDVVAASECVMACARTGDAASNLVVNLTFADGRGPTCAELSAAFASQCVVDGCTCMEKVGFKTGVDQICASGESTVDYMESGEFATKLRENEQAQCAQEFAVTAKQLPTNTSSALGVRLLLSTTALGYKDTWHPKKNRLQPRVPHHNERAGVKAPTTFKIYTQCKTDQVKELGGEFWFKSISAAYIVRHNYGAGDFFGDNSRLRMERVELEDGVFGYTLTTNQVDWEYGIELENSDGETFLEIGKVNNAVPTALQRETCARRFGEYFNRVLTDEDDPSSVSYVFGDCDTQCPADYMDSAYCNQPITGTIPNEPGAAISLGETHDARLVNIASAMLWSSSTNVLNYQGARTYVTKYDNGSKNQQDWIVGVSDRERNVIKMAMIRVSRDEVTGEGKVWRIGTRKHTLTTTGGYEYVQWNHPSSQGTGCKQMYCNVARYPLPSMWNSSASNSGGDYTVMRLQYTKLSLGDAPPTQFTSSFDSGLLSSSTPTQLLAPGTWGEDIDVRRVILRTGTLCGGSINWENCMFANAIPANPVHWSDYSGPTKTKKQWLIVLMDGYFKMQRIEVTVGDDEGVYARGINAKYVVRSVDSSDPSTFDPLAYDLSQLLSASPQTQPIAQGSYTSSGYGVGALTFQLAAEMSASLRGVSC